MPDKKEITSTLNEFFGLDINWERLSKTDLEKLYNFLNNPKNIIHRLVDILGAEEYIKLSNDVFAEKLVQKRPVRTLLKELLFGRGD